MCVLSTARNLSQKKIQCFSLFRPGGLGGHRPKFVTTLRLGLRTPNEKLFKPCNVCSLVLNLKLGGVFIGSPPKIGMFDKHE